MMIKNLYDFLFYCFYSFVLTRKGDYSYGRSNAILSILIATNFVSLFFGGLLIYNKNLPDALFLFGTVFGYLGIHVFGLIYFQKGDYYKVIIEKYQTKNGQSKYKMIALLYALGTFFFLVFCLVVTDKIINH